MKDTDYVVPPKRVSGRQPLPGGRGKREPRTIRLSEYYWDVVKDMGQQQLERLLDEYQERRQAEGTVI